MIGLLEAIQACFRQIRERLLIKVSVRGSIITNRLTLLKQSFLLLLHHQLLIPLHVFRGRESTALFPLPSNVILPNFSQLQIVLILQASFYSVNLLLDREVLVGDCGWYFQRFQVL